MSKGLWVAVVACLAVASGAMFPGGASASTPTTAAILSVSQPNSKASYGAMEEVANAVAHALNQKGMTVTSARDVQLMLVGKKEASCREVTCASSVARVMGVDYVVLITCGLLPTSRAPSPRLTSRSWMWKARARGAPAAI
jgi:hypothetical protein